MADIIQSTINKVLGDGARLSKFKCHIILPTPFTNLEGKELDTIIKSTAFPTRINEVITIQHKGRDIPLPGQEKFIQELEIVFYMQEDHRNKYIFDQWAEALNYANNRYSDNPDSMVTQLSGNQNALKTSIKLTQMDFSNTDDRITYEFFNTFPKVVQGSQAASDSVNTIGEFTVTFVFSHYETIVDNRSSLITPLDYQPFGSESPRMIQNRTARAQIDTSVPYKETKGEWLEQHITAVDYNSIANDDNEMG